MPSTDGGAGQPRLAAAVLVAGIIALAFNLRPAITSLPPVFPELASRLGLSSAAVTALATIPVVCFGVFSGLAARLSRRFGDEQALLAALIVLAVSPGTCAAVSPTSRCSPRQLSRPAPSRS